MIKDLPNKIFAYGTMRQGCKNFVVVDDLAPEIQPGSLKGFDMFHYAEKGESGVYPYI